MLAATEADCVVLTTPAACIRASASTPPRRLSRDDREAHGHPLARGLDMVRACDEASVRLFVVKQNRRNPTLQMLKNAVSQVASGASTW